MANIDESFALCQKRSGRGPSVFARGFRMLPPAKRRGMIVLGAFFQYTNHLSGLPVSSVGDRSVRRTLLSSWYESVANLTRPNFRPFQESEGQVLLPALASVVQEFGVPIPSLCEVILGAERKNADQVRFDTERELLTWCDQMATAASRASLAVLGSVRDQRDPVVQQQVVACARAFQFTRILCDLREDFAADRCYFPMEEMARFGVTHHDFQDAFETRQSELTQRFRLKNLPLATFFHDRIRKTEDYYYRSRRLGLWLAPDARPAFRLVETVTFRLFQKIKACPTAPFFRQIDLTWSEKLRFLLFPPR